MLPLLPEGRRLRMYRMANGWTQRDLANAAGLTESYVSELERGIKQGGPRGWKRLADALNISVLDLISHQEKVG